MASLLVHLGRAIALAVLVSLILIPVSDGRQIKSMQWSRSTPSVSQSIDTSAPKKVIPFTAPGERTGFGQSGVANQDDFHPTTPGNSPGVGHSIEGFVQRVDATVGFGRKTIKGSHHLTGSLVNDFRATGPGHSPGVGHTVGNVNSEPKP